MVYLSSDWYSSNWYFFRQSGIPVVRLVFFSVKVVFVGVSVGKILVWRGAQKMAEKTLDINPEMLYEML